MQVAFHRDFLRSLAKLSRRNQTHFYTRLDIFKTNSQHPLLGRHALHGKWSGCFSINITGDLRAIVTLDTASDTATFLQIGTHHQLYRT